MSTPTGLPSLTLKQQRWLLAGLTLCVFFFALGSRSLNEPDEGRYSTIASEMVERGDWLVPHFWYAPHLDKPPFTYWAVAASLSIFGHNEWAVRLPLALAAISGVVAIFFLVRSIRGERAAIWSALVLQSSVLYFVMGRMLTTDIFLTQFTAWGFFFLWKAWRALDRVGDPKGGRTSESTGGSGPASRVAGSCAGWMAGAGAVVGLAFLAKGPLALLVPTVGFGALLVYARPSRAKWGALAPPLLLGTLVFALVAVPWFLAVNQRVPGTLHFMVFGQALGHALGTTVQNRSGHPLYFLPVLAAGFLPWTSLLGWLWRRAHWRSLAPREREAWLLASAWAILPFIFFSIARSKLPAYILPIFPPLAMLTAMRWFGDGAKPEIAPPPPWLWRVCALSPMLVMIGVPVGIRLLFKPAETEWIDGLACAGLVLLALFGWQCRTFDRQKSVRLAAGFSLLSLAGVLLAVPSVETSFKSNQTIKPLGEVLCKRWRPEDATVCWQRLPQGLAFYGYPAISAEHRPYFGAMPLDRVPFEFTGNRERFSPYLLKDEEALAGLVGGARRVWVITATGGLKAFNEAHPTMRLRTVIRCGLWELLVNAPSG